MSSSRLSITLASPRNTISPGKNLKKNLRTFRLYTFAIYKILRNFVESLVYTHYVLSLSILEKAFSLSSNACNSPMWGSQFKLLSNL